MYNSLDAAMPPSINSPTVKKMHILQPKHTILSEKEEQELLEKLNISKAQLPKIFIHDPMVPENSVVGDILKIERKQGDDINIYYRVIV